MSQLDRNGFSGARIDVPAPGDVFLWHSDIPDKEKFHLCLSHEFDFVFLNTPKDVRFRSDFEINADDIHFLKPTKVGFSAVSCRDPQQVGDLATFHSRSPEFFGKIALTTLVDLLDHVIALDTVELRVIARLEDVRAETLKTLPPRGWPPF